MLKPQHVFIRSLLALNITDDSLHLLSKLQIILSAALLSKTAKYLKLLRKVLNYSCQSVSLRILDMKEVCINFMCDDLGYPYIYMLGSTSHDKGSKVTYFNQYNLQKVESR